METPYFPGAEPSTSSQSASNGHYGGEQAFLTQRGRTISEGQTVPSLPPFAFSLASLQQRSLPNLYQQSPVEYGFPQARPLRDPSSPDSEPDRVRPRMHARQRSQSFTHPAHSPSHNSNPLANSMPRPTLPFLPARMERLHASIPSPRSPRSQNSPRNSSPRTTSPRNSPRNLAKSEKRFPCPVPSCESGYARRTVLLRHFSTKHPQLYHLYPEMKPDEIACPVPGCTSTFLRKGNLIHHYRRFHPDMTYNQHSAFKWTVEEGGSESGTFEYDFSENGDFSDDNMDLSGSRRSSDFSRQFHNFTLDEASILPEHPFEADAAMDVGPPLPMFNPYGGPSMPHYAHMTLPQDYNMAYTGMTMNAMDVSFKRENDDERPEMFQDPLNDFHAQM